MAPDRRRNASLRGANRVFTTIEDGIDMNTAFVTGAAVGQGNLLAKRLAGDGWQVFAGVLPGADTDLRGRSGITVVDQDVSKADSVRSSAEAVRSRIGNDGLHLLLNVAGVADLAIGVMECLSVENAQRLFDINTFGQLRVVQSFLPLLRQARPPARIFNYCSGAILVNPPLAGAYNMSKHAVHGMTLTMRHELASFGIQVTSILPGGVKTAMTANAHEGAIRQWAKLPPEIRRVYGPSLEHPFKKVLPDLLEKNGSSAEAITDQVLRLVSARKLKPMYLVGGDARPLGPMHRLLSPLAFESLIRRIYRIPGYGGRR
jgi:NAD(P)-dependent dehydrogenase (short-subunit alcohol dehydrogenase family)